MSLGGLGDKSRDGEKTGAIGLREASHVGEEPFPPRHTRLDIVGRDGADVRRERHPERMAGEFVGQNE